jgi:hypothetical protein
MDSELCEACLTRPALGVLTLHTAEGEHVAAWWTCARCADHDAPIHDARGLVVAVWVSDPEALSWPLA